MRRAIHSAASVGLALAIAWHAGCGELRAQDDLGPQLDAETLLEPPPDEEMIVPPLGGEPMWEEPPSIESEGSFFEPAGQATEEALCGPPAWGEPLQRSSWLHRPYSISGFAGALLMDDPLRGQVSAGTGFVPGFRLGFDPDAYWGLEARFAFSKIALEYLPTSQRQQGDLNYFSAEASWLWYPLGDTKWRPYLSLGLGLTDVDFYETATLHNAQTLFSLPFGLGMKYRLGNRAALRFEILDSVAFGNGSELDDMHNISITGGLEWRIGSLSKPSYWPWNPGRTWW